MDSNCARWCLSPTVPSMQDFTSLCRLGDHLQGHDLDRTAGNDPGGLGVMPEEGALLQGDPRPLVEHRGEVIIVRAVAALHAAITDLALERRVAVERGDERRDLAVPVLRHAGGMAVLDEKLLHVAPPRWQNSRTWEQERKYGQK